MTRERVLRKAAILATLVVALGTTACGSSENKKISNVIAEPLENPIVEGNHYNDSIIGEMCTMQGIMKIVYGEEDTYNYEYSLRIPEIKEDTPGAKQINEEIHKIYDPIMDTIHSADEEGKVLAENVNNDYTWCQKVYYESYWNESVLSLLITNVSYVECAESNLVFNYDASTGTVLSNNDIISRAGFNQDNWMAGVRRAAAYESDRQIRDYFDIEMQMSQAENRTYDNYIQQTYLSFLKNRQETLSENNINEEMPIYMDEEGNLKVIFSVFTSIGDGVLRVSASPRDAKGVNELHESYKDMIYVDYDGESLILRIEENGWSKQLFPVRNIDYGSDYLVTGVFKNYIDCKFVTMDQNEVPYIVLLSDDGMISYVRISQGVESGQFVLTDPLWGCYDISYFEERPGENNASDWYAISEEGDELNIKNVLNSAECLRWDGYEKLAMGLYDVEGYSVTLKHKVDGGNSYEDEAYIGYDSEEEDIFVLQNFNNDAGICLVYNGKITLAGMDEKGLIFQYELYSLDGQSLNPSERRYGSFRFIKHPYWDSEKECVDDGATIEWVSGTDLFDSQGVPVVFIKTFG